jgi:hypothetical protein
MRAATLIAAIAAVALIGACSRHDDHAANADVRGAEGQLKAAGHDAAKDFRKLAAEAKVEAHKLGADTRQAAHNVSQPDRSDSRS